MSQKIIYSIAESPAHPDLHALYTSLNYSERHFTSTRKAIQALKKDLPDVLIADFIYGYGNNYAGVNVCNLDVFMYTLAKYQVDIPLILFSEKAEVKFIEKFSELFTIKDFLTYPIDTEKLEGILKLL